MTPLSTEISFWAAAYVVNSLCIWAGYHRGARAWLDKFGHDGTDQNGKATRISGRWGEFVVNTFWFGGILLITLFCERALLTEFPTWKWLAILTTITLVIFGVNRHVRSVIEAETKLSDELLTELKRGYDFYRLFPYFLYLGVLLGLAKILIQFSADVETFFQAAESLLASQAQIAVQLGASVDLTDIQLIERGFIEYNSLNHSIIQQLEPIMIFVIYVMFVLILLVQTPIRHSFHKDARQAGFYFSLASIFLTFFVAAGVHYFQYAKFSADYLSTIQAFAQLDFVDFSYLGRLSEILEQILDFSGFSGFLKIFAEEGGIYIVALALAQMTSSMVSKKDGKASEKVSQ